MYFHKEVDGMLFWQRLGTTVLFINISSASGFRGLSNWQKSFICLYGIIWSCQSYRRRANARNLSLVINSVDKTKLPCLILPHWRSTTAGFFKNLPLLFMTRLSSKAKPYYLGVSTSRYPVANTNIKGFEFAESYGLLILIWQDSAVI